MTGMAIGKDRERNHELMEFGGRHDQKLDILQGHDTGAGVGAVNISLFKDGQGKVLVLKGERDPDPAFFDHKDQVLGMARRITYIMLL